jgi:hypothetical protein
MKILKLEDSEPINKDVFYNLSQLVATYGKEFYVLFRNRRIPFIVKRRVFKPKDNMKQKAIYKISVAYLQTKDMQYPTLNMSIGEDYRAPESGHIDYVHRNAEHDLSGTYIVDLAIAFMKYVAVNEVTLTDAAMATDSNTSSNCKFPLAPYLLLKKKTTFYGKWGFKPSASQYNTSFEDDKMRLKSLCQIVGRIQKTKVEDVIAMLNKWKTTLSTLKDIPKMATYNIIEDFETGIKSDEDYDDDWDYKKLEQLLSKIDKIIGHLTRYEKNTIHEMVQTCTCLEFKSLLQSGSYHRYSGIPHVIQIGKKKIVNKYFPVFQELGSILSMGSYSLDLTAKQSKGTCS